MFLISSTPARSRSRSRSHSRSRRSRHSGGSTSLSLSDLHHLSSTTRQVATKIVKAAFSHSQQQLHNYDPSLAATKRRTDSDYKDAELEAATNASSDSSATSPFRVQVCPVLVIAASNPTTPARKPVVTHTSSPSSFSSNHSRYSYEHTKPISSPMQQFRPMSPPPIATPVSTPASLLPSPSLSSDRDRVNMEMDLKIALRRAEVAEMERRSLQLKLDNVRQQHIVTA